MDFEVLLLQIYLRVQIIYYKCIKTINGNMNKQLMESIIPMNEKIKWKQKTKRKALKMKSEINK